jgi:PEP-CTERM motif
MKSLLTACALIVVAAPLLLADAPAVPEPGSFVLLGTGVAGLGFAIWRRSRTKK